jgi:hypothetical protein
MRTLGRHARRATLADVSADDLPTPPTLEVVEAWAGAGRVNRADESHVGTWRLPEPQKAALTSSGVPLIDGLVSGVSFRADPETYRLAYCEDELSNVAWVYNAAPRTGAVLALSPGGGTRFVNSTVNHWLCSLHLVGSWLTHSTVIDRWDEDAEAEDQAFVELAALLERIRAVDPPAVGDGDHEQRFWPAVLDRWLY